MSNRREYEVPDAIFPHNEEDEWHVREVNFLPRHYHLNETIFVVGNGYLGTRGNFDEPYEGGFGSENGTFINGFYENHPISYPETAYGLANMDNVMLNITNPKSLILTIEDKKSNITEQFTFSKGKVDQYMRQMDMRRALMTRQCEWTSPSGKILRILYARIAHQNRKHLLLFRYQFTPVNFAITSDVIVRVSSAIDSKVSNKASSDDPRVGSGISPTTLRTLQRYCSYNGTSQLSSPTPLSSLKMGGYILTETSLSNLAMTCAFDHVVTPAPASVSEGCNRATFCEVDFIFNNVPEGTVCTVDKFVSYVTSRDCPEVFTGHTLQDVLDPPTPSYSPKALDPNANPSSTEDEYNLLVSKGIEEVADARELGWCGLFQEHEEFMKKFWESADVEIIGDSRMQQGLRFNIIQLLMSTGRDGKTNVGAKGVTGEGYSGHYFWDTEIYVMPFFIHTRPEIARSLLQFRYNLLPAARQRARTMAIPKGALFPWRTIAGGECSSYFPAGTAQVHINADVAFAVQRYVESTNDEDFLFQYGAEILIEMARFWVESGTWTESGHFEIHGVTGPDEYKTLVNNNYYTNIMAQTNLQYAFDVANRMQREKQDEFTTLSEKISLEESEIDGWKKAADAMFLPYDPILGIHPQDDSFLKKIEWDWANTPTDKYPLLLNYHPMVIYRHRVCKQADLLLAEYLIGDRFTVQQKKQDFEYYEQRTTHDSSLSPCVFSIMAAEVGKRAKAYKYFMQTARLDLENTHHNAQHGVHIACMAGAWHCLVSGFAGMRTYGAQLRFDPYLPEQWLGYRFKIMFRGSTLAVEVNSRNAMYTLLSGERVRFIHSERSRVTLKTGKSIILPLRQKYEEINSFSFETVVFDIESLVTNMSKLHFNSWKVVLEEFLTKVTQDPEKYYVFLTSYRGQAEKDANSMLIFNKSDLDLPGEKPIPPAGGAAVLATEASMSRVSSRKSLSIPASCYNVEHFVKETEEIPVELDEDDFDRYLRHQHQKFVKSVGQYSNVQAFLYSRGLALPRGSTDDPPYYDTICGIYNAKAQEFRKQLTTVGLQLREGAFNLVKDLKDEGIAVGLTSFSKSLPTAVETIQLSGWFDAILDGAIAERLGLKGKPTMDYFNHITEQLNSDPKRTVLFINDLLGFDPVELKHFKMVCAPCDAELSLHRELDHTDVPPLQKAAGADKCYESLEGVNADVIDKWIVSMERELGITNDNPFLPRVAHHRKIATAGKALPGTLPPNNVPDGEPVVKAESKGGEKPEDCKCEDELQPPTPKLC